jgi:hypothetical protein
MLDSTHVGVTAAEKDVAKERLFGPSAFDSVVDVMDLGFWESAKFASEEGLRGPA